MVAARLAATDAHMALLQGPAPAEIAAQCATEAAVLPTMPLPDNPRESRNVVWGENRACCAKIWSPWLPTQNHGQVSEALREDKLRLGVSEMHGHYFFSSLLDSGGGIFRTICIEIRLKQCSHPVF